MKDHSVLWISTQMFFYQVCARKNMLLSAKLKLVLRLQFFPNYLQHNFHKLYLRHSPTNCQHFNPSQIVPRSISHKLFTDPIFSNCFRVNLLHIIDNSVFTEISYSQSSLIVFNSIVPTLSSAWYYWNNSSIRRFYSRLIFLNCLHSN